MLLNKHNLAVADFAAKGESRFAITSVHVSESGTMATDGEALVRVSLPNQRLQSHFPSHAGFEPDDGSGVPWLLPADAAKAISKALPKRSTLPVLQHACVGKGDDTSAAILVTDLSNPQVFRPRKSIGQFPIEQAERFLTEPRKVSLRIQFDGILLAKMLKFAEDFTDAGQGVTMEFTDKDSAVWISADNVDSGQSVTAAVMPIIGGKGSKATVKAAAHDDSFDSAGEIEIECAMAVAGRDDCR